jgi:heme/copper-type cytochrome/quinol oxidase subunit 2
MRLRLLVISLLTLATSAFAKDVFLSIGGSAGVFHTDARIFNPSTTKDIQIQAYLLLPPTPQFGGDNSGAQPTTITVPKRQMAVYNDVVQSLFNSGVSLAAIRLKSDDDFIATQRIYAQSNAGCVGTLGQFVPGLDVSTAAKQGVLIQLKSSASFRTNIGLVNPNGTLANVTWHLYDKNNAVVGTVNTSAVPAAIQPFGVVTPINITSVFSAPGADLSDAWVSFSSDQPIFAYASVVDNGTIDPTFIPMSADSGGTPIVNQPATKTYNVLERSFQITVSPSIGNNDLKIGDRVTFHITVQDSTHGFELNDPNGNAVIPSAIFSPGDVVDKTFTVTAQGTYTYFCTNSSCGFGHNSMSGSFNVGQSSDPGGPGY